jgi:DNA polymerase-4
MKKPDAVTVISEENFKEKIWPLPVEDLLYVGRKTKTLLNKKAIYTIGDLAGADIILLNDWLGKSAYMLHDYANGLDNSPVMHYDCKREFKSIGNSTTFPYDLTTEPQVRSSLVFLADYVSQRLRNEGVKGREITVSVRDNKMHWISHRRSIERPTDISNEIAHHAMELFKESYGWIYPVRSLGISVGRLGNEDFCIQLDLLSDEEKRSKQHIIDTTGDMLRKKFGDTIICKAVTLMNKDVAHL